MPALRALLLLSVLCSGCLRPSYHIARDELQRVASLEPAQRGQRVHGVQQLSLFGPETPGEASREGDIAIDVDSGASTPDSGSELGLFIAGAIVATAVVATSVAIAGIASEGSRFDGDLRLAPAEPIYLYRERSNGSLEWVQVPVSQLEPNHAAWAEGGVVERSGGLHEENHGPLNRVGFAFSKHWLFSQGHSPIAGRRTLGGSRLSFGVFPSQYVGILLTTEVQGANRVWNLRNGAELQVFVPNVQRMHFGMYGEVGRLGAIGRLRGQREFDAQLYLGAGALFQVELKARLALELRVGFWHSERRVYPTAGLGLVIY